MKKKWISILCIMILTIIPFGDFGIQIAKAETEETTKAVKSEEEEEISMKFIDTRYIHASDGTVWSTEGEKVLEHIQEVKVIYEDKGEDYVYYLTKFGELYFTGYTSGRRIGNNAKNKQEHAFSTYGFQEDAACLLVKNVREFGGGYAIQNDGTLYVWGRHAGYNSRLVSSQFDVEQPTRCTKIDHVKKFLIGGAAYIVLKEDGTVWTIGSNYFALIGNGKQSTLNSGQMTRFYQVSIPKVTDIFMAGGSQSLVCALTEDYTLYAWGTSENTQTKSYEYIKLPTVIHKNIVKIQKNNLQSRREPKGSYTQVYGIDSSGNAYNLDYKGFLEEKKPEKLDDMQSIYRLSDDSSQMYLALKRTKSLWSWGNNTYGCLGNGKTEPSKPGKILDHVEKLEYGHLGTQTGLAAINKKRELYCWGVCYYNREKYSGYIKEPAKVDDNVLDVCFETEYVYYVNKSGYVYTWKFEGLSCLNPTKPITIGDRYTVRVVEEKAQEGIAGIPVEVNDSTVVTDKDGYARMMGINLKYGKILKIRVNNNSYDSDVSYTCYSDCKEYSKENNSLKVELKVQENLSFGLTGFNCTIPEQVPLLGGLQTKLSFFDDNTNLDGKNSFPFDLRYDPVSETYYACIGWDTYMRDNYGYETPKDLWSSIKSIKNKNGFKDVILPEFYQNDDFRGNSKLKNEFSKDINFGCYGYLEGTKKYLKGELYGFADGRYNGEVNVYPGGVPILLKLDVGAKATLGGKILQTDNKSFEGEIGGVFQIPDIMLSAGVGIRRVFDVSVYGQCYQTLTLGSKSWSGSLTGNAGVSYKLLMFTGKYPIINGSYSYPLGSSSKKVSSYALRNTDNTSKEEDCSLTIDRSYLDTQSTWRGDERKNKIQAFISRNASSAKENENVITLQKSIYGNATPQLVTTEDGLKMMVYTTDLGDRSTGNNTEVAYSIYNENTSTWSTPKIVEDDGTADFSPAIGTDGKDIYVAWVNTTQKFDKNVDYREMAEKCDIAVAKYNAGKDVFESSKNVSGLEKLEGANTSNLAEMMPSIAVKNGKAYVAWWANSANDLFGAEENSTDYVVCADNASGEWKVREYASSRNNEIKAIEIGLLGEEVAVAYSVGTDGNPNTSNDVEIFAGNYTGSGKRITNNNFAEDILSFEKIGGKHVFTYYGGNTIFSASDLNSQEPLVTNVALSEYSIIPGEERDALMYVQAEGESSNIYTLFLGKDMVSGEIPVTHIDGYVNSVSGYMEQGIYKLAFTKTKAAINKDSVEENVDLCVANVMELEDLAITDVACGEITNAKILPINVMVQNHGFHEAAKYTVVAEVDGEEVYREISSTTIGIGKDTILTLELPLKQQLTKESELTITVIPESQKDSNPEDNTYQIWIGKADLSVKVNEVPLSANINPLDVIVENNGNIAATTTLHIYSSENPDKELKTYSVGEIEKGENTTFRIPAKDMAVFGNKGDSLIISAKADCEEISETNNSGYFYYEKQPVKNMQLSKENIIFETLGMTEQVTASVSPEDADNKEIVWISENEDIAAVTTNGAITAMSNGITQIKGIAVDGSEVMASCEVVVQNNSVIETTTPILTASPKITNTPTITPIETQTQQVTPTPRADKVTIYYANSSWRNANIHYKIGEGDWTSVPGERMAESSEQTGYTWKYEVDMGTSNTITLCFNNGEGIWDNNGNQDYTITGFGTYGIKDSKVIKLVEENIPVRTEVPTPTSTPNTNAITIYYANSNWTNANVHYKVGEGDWTSVPGERMTESSEQTGYTWKYEVDMGTSNTITLCFNNGAGIWDNNNNRDYTITGVGIYGIKNGVITNLTPVVTPEITTTPQITNTPKVTRTPQVTRTPMVTPTPKITGTPEITTTPQATTSAEPGKVTIFYANDNFRPAYIYYRTGGEDWEIASRAQMSRSYEKNGYTWKYTLDLKENEKLTVCFSNMEDNYNEEKEWDTKNGSYYQIAIPGVYGIKNQEIRKLHPPTTQFYDTLTIYYSNSKVSTIGVRMYYRPNAMCSWQQADMEKTSDMEGYEYAYLIEHAVPSMEIKFRCITGYYYYEDIPYLEVRDPEWPYTYQIGVLGMYGIKDGVIENLDDLDDIN